MSCDLASISIRHLEKIYAEARETDPRRAAEMAYVLSIDAARASQTDRAREFGASAVALFDGSESGTLEGAAAVHNTIAGITIPEIIHAGVVRSRLAQMGITI